jgi:sRNA-binding carbon storage regulator CsrA
MHGLTLSRRIGERLIIRLEDGREVVIRLESTTRGRDGGSARLLIQAPRSVQVSREEIAYPRLAAQRQGQRSVDDDGLIGIPFED